PSRRRNTGSSLKAGTWLHNPPTPGRLGLMIDQKSSTSSFGFISTGRSSSSSISPGIITCPICPLMPDFADSCNTLWASSRACSRPRSTLGGTTSIATVFKVNELLLIERLVPPRQVRRREPASRHAPRQHSEAVEAVVRGRSIASHQLFRGRQNPLDSAAPNRLVGP